MGKVHKKKLVTQPSDRILVYIIWGFKNRPSTPSGQFLEFTFLSNIVIFYEKRYLEDACYDTLYCDFNR